MQTMMTNHGVEQPLTFNGKVRVSKAGDRCRNCGIKVKLVQSQRSQKGGFAHELASQTCWYTHYLHCSGCRRNYFLDEYKIKTPPRTFLAVPMPQTIDRVSAQVCEGDFSKWPPTPHKTGQVCSVCCKGKVVLKFATDKAIAKARNKQSYYYARFLSCAACLASFTSPDQRRYPQ